ncbi:MAG TPA: NAD(P)-dependent oxidoreductase, partial [Gemmataceae bacterium]|nr:NAD(P)-dependent oxidoreductase [Gemmataceae bacterium]
MSLFPLFVDLAGKRVVVVGGGKVGRRKAAAAIAAGAVVCVVDPFEASGGRQPPGVSSCEDQNRVADATRSPEHISSPYSPEHIADAHLVFACATPEVNARVVADATARGIWVNSATDGGDVLLPAVVKCGDLTIAVSTGGASPALAKR